MQGLSEASPRVCRERGIHARSRSGVARRPGARVATGGGLRPSARVNQGGEMNRVDRSREFDAQGRALVSDPPIMRLVQRPADTPPELPSIEDDGSDRDLVALAGRLNAGVAVQLLLDRTTLQTFVTTAVAGDCLTVEVEGTEAWDVYRSEE